VRILRSATEDEVLATFVRGEVDSPRYGKTVRKLIDRVGDNPRAILGAYRSWPDQGLFYGFPKRVEWFRAALAPDEVLDILYINWDWWLRVSEGSRSPRDAAALLRSDAIPGNPVEEEDELVARAAGTNPELIAVRAPESYLVLLEGHVRLTSYALFPEYLPRELEIYLGESPRMAEWCQY
jgi:hypothetical protein